MILIFSLVGAFCVMGVSLSGVLFTRGQLGVWMKDRIGYLTSFATGVIAVLVLHLIQESFEEASLYYWVGVALLVGIGSMEIVHRYIPAHDHCEDMHDHSLEASHAHTPIDGRRVLLSDAVHNISDGFILVLAFSASIWAGILATCAVIAHETVQEISEFFVLKESGYSDREALIRNFVASTTILLGVILAYLFSDHEVFLAVTGAFAAGGFLSVLARDLVPHLVSELRHTSHRSLHVAALCVGAVLMFGVTTLAPHEHNHEVESVHVSTLR